MSTRTKNPAPAVKLSLFLFCVLALTGEASVGMTAVNEQSIMQDPAWMTLRFEANEGQADDDVMFLARGHGFGLLLKSTEVVLKSNPRSPSAVSTSRRQHAAPVIDARALEPSTLTMKLVNANSRSRVAGLEKLPGKVNSFVGRDPTRWRTNVATYARIKYHDVYPGVDLVYYGNPRQLEYDFVVAPHADPNAITLEFPDTERLTVDGHGDLVLHAAGGQFRMRKPLIYQVVNGSREMIAGSYALRAATHQVGFHIGSYDRDRPLVIDPVLGYSTYLGTVGADSGHGIASIGGAVYVTGESNGQAFVAKLNPALSGPASLVYFTVFGGSGGDSGHAITLDPGAFPHVTGSTSSLDFPVVDAAQSTYAGGARDAFVAKLDSTGALVRSTYLGGSGDDVGLALSLRCVSGTAARAMRS
jgi:hypothetical protein